MDRNGLLLALKAEFIRGFLHALDHSLGLAPAHLMSKSDASKSGDDQRRYLDARIYVMNTQPTLRQQIVASMDRLLNRSFQTAYNHERPQLPNHISSNALSLLDTSEFEQSLQIDDFSKRYRDEAEDELRDFNIRVALLFEQEDVRERENPFRPYLLTRSISASLESTELPVGEISILVQQLSEGMLGQIKEIYAALNALLAEQGVAAELQYKIRKLPERLDIPAMAHKPAAAVQGPETNASWPQPGQQASSFQPAPVPVPAPSRVDQLLDLIRSADAPPVVTGPVSAEMPTAAAQFVAPAAASMQQIQTNMVPPAEFASGVVADKKANWLPSFQSAGTALRHFFSGPRIDHAIHEDFLGDALPIDQPAAPTIFAPTPLEGAIQDFQKSKTPAVHEMVGEDGRVRNLILEERAHLSAMVQDHNEQMIIDIVAMLFEFILRDPMVPAEVRAQLGRLQFLILRIALQDPELFSREYHDVRLLVNRIGSISLGLQQVDPSGSKISAEISWIVDELLQDEDEGLAIFAKMLDELDAFVARELLAADSPAERAVEAMTRAENRTLQFARISSMIASGLSSLVIEDYLRDFLVNTWARAIERAGRDSELQASRFRTMVPELIWSIAPKVLPEERHQVLEIIPKIISTLGEGLALIDWPQQERHELMSWLVESHRHALRATHVPAPVPPLTYIEELYREFISNEVTGQMSTPESVPDQPLDGPLLKEAIAELEVSLNLIDQMVDLTIEELAEADTATENDDTEARLQIGALMEVNLDGTPTLAHMNWVEGNHLVLTMEAHDAPSVISLRVFRRLLSTGRARFVENEPLFERAIQKLLTTADKIDRPVS